MKQKDRVLKVHTKMATILFMSVRNFRHTMEVRFLSIYKMTQKTMQTTQGKREGKMTHLKASSRSRHR